MERCTDGGMRATGRALRWTGRVLGALALGLLLWVIVLWSWNVSLAEHFGVPALTPRAALGLVLLALCARVVLWWRRGTRLADR